MSDRTDQPRPWDRQVRALCCVCGTLRMTSTRGSSGEVGHLRRDGARCLVWRKCVTCGERTTHAFLRDGDQCADMAESVGR